MLSQTAGEIVSFLAFRPFFMYFIYIYIILILILNSINFKAIQTAIFYQKNPYKKFRPNFLMFLDHGVLRWWLKHQSHHQDFYTLPFCSLGHTISKNVFLSSLGLLLPVLVKFYRYNRELIEKLTLEKFLKKALFNAILANLKPKNSNVENYLLKSGLRIGFLWPKVSFLAYPNIWKISIFDVI